MGAGCGTTEVGHMHYKWLLAGTALAVANAFVFDQTSAEIGADLPSLHTNSP
jgi:hypothetical protein